MTVSVLLPTYNQAAFLPDALSALDAQTCRDFELVACDDASTDGTAQILHDRAIATVTHAKNSGTALAINSAWSIASRDTPYVTWVSSDNVMSPDWLATLVQHLDDHPDHGAVYSAYFRDEEGRRIPVYPGAYDPKTLISTENSYFGPSFLIRREVWVEHKGLTAHDYFSWTRIEENCWERGMTIGYVNIPLCVYRVGPWCTVRQRPHHYDAGKWRAEAIARRVSAGTCRAVQGTT